MIFATGCSGVNSCALAWLPLGWEEVFCAEVEPFPTAVLAQKFGASYPEALPPKFAKALKRNEHLFPQSPKMPNLGDLTRPDFVARAQAVLAGRRLDVLCMGTPCQGYSVAGKRGSMTDARSNLMFCFVEAYHGLGATWAVWENVPGCLNTRDNAFGHLLTGLSGAAETFVGPDARKPGKWPSAGAFEGPAGGGFVARARR